MIIWVLCLFYDSLADIAVERWELCEVAKRNNATLLAFDNGLKFRPIKTYFQNLFCELAQVNVIYPYANTKIQKFVRSLDFPARYCTITSLHFTSLPMLHVN